MTGQIGLMQMSSSLLFPSISPRNLTIFEASESLRSFNSVCFMGFKHGIQGFGLTNLNKSRAFISVSVGSQTAANDAFFSDYKPTSAFLFPGQPVFFSTKAYVSLIKPDQSIWYHAYKTCNKKVTEAIGSGFWCEGCQKNDEECSLRYIMVAKVYDARGEAWLSSFNDQLEKILGCSADELDELKSQVKLIMQQN